jgi:hypothetical protein
MRILCFITICLFILSNFCYSQSATIRVVLKKNHPNKVFSFDSSSKANGLYTTYITYLGRIRSNGKEFKIVKVKTVWGPNKHTFGTVFIYDMKNEFFGKYNLGDGFDLPSKLLAGQLIFDNKNKKECDQKLITKIDFAKNIPAKIFLKCKDEQGDIYTFSREND